LKTKAIPVIIGETETTWKSLPQATHRESTKLRNCEKIHTGHSTHTAGSADGKNTELATFEITLHII